MKRSDLTTEQEIVIIKKMGWTVTCQSPLNIEHPDGSFASGQAADYLAEALIEEYDSSDLEEYKYIVTQQIAMGFIPLQIKRLSDGDLLHLNVDEIGEYTYSFKHKDMPVHMSHNYLWNEDTKIYNPLDFRVISWTTHKN